MTSIMELAVQIVRFVDDYQPELSHANSWRRTGGAIRSSIRCQFLALSLWMRTACILGQARLDA